MFFNKEKKQSKFVRAKTPESREKQKAAIREYYAKEKAKNEKQQIKKSRQ